MDLLMLFFVFVGMYVPLIRFISLEFFRTKMAGRYLLPTGLFVLSLVLLMFIPGRISLLLTGPLLSQLILEKGEQLYAHMTGEEIFEANDNSFDPEENPFFMSFFDSILSTLAIMAPCMVYVLFK